MKAKQKRTVSQEKKEFIALGIKIQVLASNKDTNGAYSLMHYTLPACILGAPPHYHKKMSEAFYVLEGKLSILQNDIWVTVKPGAYVLIPPGTTHGFRNDTSDETRFLILASPGGLENLYDDLFNHIHIEHSWPPQDPLVLQNLGIAHDTYYHA